MYNRLREERDPDYQKSDDDQQVIKCHSNQLTKTSASDSVSILHVLNAAFINTMIHLHRSIDDPALHPEAR
jgi:hypothetical protein